MTDINKEHTKKSRQKQETFEAYTNDSQKLNILENLEQKFKDDIKQTKEDLDKLVDCITEGKFLNNTDKIKYPRQTSNDYSEKKGQKRQNKKKSSDKTENFGFKPKQKEQNLLDKDWF